MRATLAKFKGKTAKFIAGMKQKYKSTPTVTEIGADRPSKNENAHQSKAGRPPSPQDLAGISLDDLQKELGRRKAAGSQGSAAAGQGEEDEEDEEEDLFLSPTSTKQRIDGDPQQVVIVGGGPAGLSAAIYAARAGLKPLVVAPAFGGQLLGKGVDVENFPGVKGEHATGRGIIELMRDQAVSFGAELMPEQLVSTDLKRSNDGHLTLILNGSSLADPAVAVPPPTQALQTKT